MIHRERRDEALVLRIEHGKVNAIDIELLEELSAALDEAAAGQCPVVLTGTGGFFSAGVNLFRIVDEGRAYADRFVPALGDAILKLFAFERPVVAAINGHAIAAGCILAAACDYRVMAEGSGKTGIPERLVGVPMPLVPLEVLRSVMRADTLQYLLVTARTIEPAEALARGVIDEIAPPAEVLARALVLAAALASVPPGAFAHSKRALRAPALERIAAGRAANEAALAPVWGAPETLEFIRGYLARTVGRGRAGD